MHSIMHKLHSINSICNAQGAFDAFDNAHGAFDAPCTRFEVEFRLMQFVSDGLLA